MKYLIRGAFPDKLLEFFVNNPDEELTYDDIAAKFDVNRHQAMNAVNRLHQAGKLESVHVVRLPQKGRAS